MDKEKFSLFWKDYKKSKAGILGLAMLLLVLGSALFIFSTTSTEDFKKWNDYKHWRNYPKLAGPGWTSLFSGKKIPKHLIIKEPEIHQEKAGDLIKVQRVFEVNFSYDELPKGFSYQYIIRYKGSSPFLVLSVLTPDQRELQLAKPSLPFAEKEILQEGTVSSVDKDVLRNIAGYFDKEVNTSSELFLNPGTGKIEKGAYKFFATFYFYNPEDRVEFSQLIIEGKVFGVLGTDVYGRDLWTGIRWGLPAAFLIGVSVAFLSLIIGLIYGVISAYSRKPLQEIMSRINYIIICVPVLPFLIIMVAAFGQSLFNIIFYLVVFGWNGIVLVVREKALQEVHKTHIEDLELEGASRSRIIFRHLIPETIPYALVNMVLGVPAAILSEAGLSFVGLGDPSLPTWGQILHDAQVAGAPALGMWWWVLPPGVAIMLTSLTFGLIAWGLDTTFAPKLRKT